jgi:molybdopterin synthase catalytic subunit
MEAIPQVLFIEGAIKSKHIENVLQSFSQAVHSGAHQIFLGQVRADHIEGQTVVGIDYSMYPEMAKKVLKQIIRDGKDRFKIDNIIIHHSTGVVKAGEICLFVAVSSPHRKACHDAIDYCVETLKKEVPIFGKEMLDNNNHVWKINQ